MIRFIIKRIIISLPLVLFLSFITLVLINMVPGNYFDQMRLNPQMSEEIIKSYETKFHINENVFIQYVYWLRNILKGDFGYSFAYQSPVISLIKSRLVNTFILSFSAFVLSWCVGIPLGLLAAFWKDSFFDRTLRALAYMFLSLPAFFLALVLLFLYGHLTHVPLGGMHSPYFYSLSPLGKIKDIFVHMSVPLMVIAVGSASYLFRLMRSQVLEVLNSDFVRVLRTRPILKRTIIFKHVFRNAVNPLITLLGFQLPALFSGAVLVEIITGWPGLGSMMLFAVRSQDIFLVMGNMVMISFLLIIGNIMADVLLAIADPRIRY